VLRAEVEVSNVKADMIQARNAMNRHMTALLRAMGASQKSEVTLTDVLSYLPGEPTYEACVQKAFLNRPELYQKEFDVQLQQAGVEVFLSHYWPTLEAWATQLWSKPDPHDQTTIHWGDEWQAGLRLKWTLFDGLRREGQIRQQRAAWKQSIIGLSDMEQKVLQEVRNALLDLRDAKELVESQQLNLQQANEALRLVDTGAREGVNTPLDVLDARSALTRTQGLYYQALHAHTVARLSLQRAMGLLGPPPGAEAVPASAPPIGVLEDVQGEQPGASGAMQGGSQPGETASPR
jgi:outer membrane protein